MRDGAGIGGKMNGPEIKAALKNLLWERTREASRRMREYDDTIYRPAEKALIEQCPHEDNGLWEGNGLGHHWTCCRWCGKRMREDSGWDQEPEA
jgi:hypothetical protein